MVSDRGPNAQVAYCEWYVVAVVDRTVLYTATGYASYGNAKCDTKTVPSYMYHFRPPPTVPAQGRHHVAEEGVTALAAVR